LIAEELDADWDHVNFEMAPAGDAYRKTDLGVQLTGGSNGLSSYWTTMRHSGAVLRELFVLSAAKKWGVRKSDCTTEKSFVHHRATNRFLAYRQLIGVASTLPLPRNVTLKKPKQYQFISKNLPALDSVSKMKGEAQYGIDITLPRMLTATVLHPPTIGAKIKSVDADEALKVVGVQKVISLGSGVAVVANNFSQALAGLEELDVEWDNEKALKLSSDQIMARWQKLSREEEGNTQYEIGNPGKALGKKKSLFESEYKVPYQAHATPEPMNCVASVQKEKCQVWAPTQYQSGVLEIAHRITGLDYDQIDVITPPIGGGYGRRIHNDFAEEAITLSQLLRVPVQVIWTRPEDMRNDYYRPASFNAMKAVMDDKGLPVAWSHQIIGVNQFAQWVPKILPDVMGKNVPNFIKSISQSMVGGLAGKKAAGERIIRGAGPLPYNIKNMKVDFLFDDPGVPLGHWRGVDYSSNVFVVECFLDEIAGQTEKDPLEMRIALQMPNSREHKVLKWMEEKANWKTDLPSGMFRGMAFCAFHGSLIATAVEISINKRSKIQVHRVICIVDCGMVVNPRVVETQIEGGIAFGLTATLKSSITITEGEVDQSNYHDFPILRMNEMPEIEIHLVPSQSKPTGVGELGVLGIAPAVANAVSDATGNRVKTLPIRLN
ncbi:MAG: xanthine dehydrogenase family protein molybdopterin-binding subunit, partial [Proteobacteria bacterium]|nr:xanthine dehydrogenase family protein molybdopterin-binding subunit [Pseudomonadota bacterium]